jgi:hypothetical protein
LALRFGRLTRPRRDAAPAGGSLSLVAPKERNQRNALNPSGGLGPAGEAMHRSDCRQPVLAGHGLDFDRRPGYGSDLPAALFRKDRFATGVSLVLIGTLRQ